MLIDIIISIILLVLFIKGIKKGFLNSLPFILAVFFIFIIPNRYENYFWELLKNYSFSYFVSKLLIYLSSFLIFYFFFKILAYLFEKILEFLHLGWLNSLFGGFLGILKGILLVWFFFFILFNISSKSENFIKEKNVSYHLYTYGNYFYQLVATKFLEKYNLNFWKNFLVCLRNLEK
uniref:CvpA family protein n=1 Tax=candidate division WOR-3 bacterium TaxID=2052148 RepID=A0A7V3ZWJ3_UNCW3